MNYLTDETPYWQYNLDKDARATEVSVGSFAYTVHNGINSVTWSGPVNHGHTYYDMRLNFIKIAYAYVCDLNAKIRLPDFEV